MAKWLAVRGVMAERPVGRHPGSQGEGADVADVLHSARTPAALSAHGDERHHDVVARREIRYAVTDFTHDAGTLVAADRREHGRQPEGAHHVVGRRHVAFEYVVVGVAQPGRGHLDEDFAGVGRVQLEFLDRPRPADVVQDRRAAFHAAGVNVTGSLLGDRKVSPTILDSSPLPSSDTKAMSLTRSSRLFNMTRVSSRARCMPRHMWTPPAKAMWACRGRRMSNLSAFVQRLSSRLAGPMHMSICAWAGIVLPPISTSSVVVRMTMVSGVSNRKPSSIAAGISDRSWYTIASCSGWVSSRYSRLPDERYVVSS